MRSLAALVLAPLLCACATMFADPPPAPLPAPASRTVWIVGADGRAVGQAIFTETPHGVLIRLDFVQNGLPPGWHGVHLHEHGDCSDPAAGFRAAGGHIGMGHNVEHGFLTRHGPEAGDLPNLFAPPAGLSATEMFNPRVTLGPRMTSDRRVPLLDADGAAIIIHANVDDFHTQPIGNAGPRIACAALTPLP